MKYELISGREFNKALSRIRLVELQLIEFTDEAAPKGVELKDLSNDGDGSIVGWIKDGTYKVSTQTKGQKVIFNEDCKKMFADFWQLKNTHFFMVDASIVKNMSGMFAYCKSLTELDLSNFDTSKVTDMHEMFAWCYNLRKIDISYFNISKVKNKNGMFCGCRALKHPDFISYK